MAKGKWRWLVGIVLMVLLILSFTSLLPFAIDDVLKLLISVFIIVLLTSGGPSIILLVVLLIALPLLSFGNDNVLTLLISVFIVAALASSWNIVAGFAGQISLGHAAFFGLGSLVMRQLWLSDVPFVISFAAGGFAAGLAALIVGMPVLRLKGIYFSIGTLALAQALGLTVANILPRVSRLPGPALRSYELSPRYYLAFAMLVVVVAVVYWLNRSKLGLGMMAVREDEAAARSIAVNVFSHRLTAFLLSATLAGFVGATFAFYHVSYYPSYTFGPEWTFDALLVTFVGGIGSLAGPLVGAAFFVLIRDTLAANLVNVHLIIFGAVFIFVVLVLPGGIIEVSTLANRWFARRSVPRNNQIAQEEIGK
jgi:branched-chain amino acid transport system permease protein